MWQSQSPRNVNDSEVTTRSQPMICNTVPTAPRRDTVGTYLFSDTPLLTSTAQPVRYSCMKTRPHTVNLTDHARTRYLQLQTIIEYFHFRKLISERTANSRTAEERFKSS